MAYTLPWEASSSIQPPLTLSHLGMIAKSETWHNISKMETNFCTQQLHNNLCEHGTTNKVQLYQYRYRYQ